MFFGFAFFLFLENPISESEYLPHSNSFTDQKYYSNTAEAFRENYFAELEEEENLLTHCIFFAAIKILISFNDNIQCHKRNIIYQFQIQSHLINLPPPIDMGVVS
ncbi:MAG TPA: hypothetical protein PKC66_12955 [Leptospiraceae bacterium]|nr:hypothetical protein [Leptospiraceae bacterium]HNF53503.1 hypothetical protein [Leptospiraceae bacterium]